MTLVSVFKEEPQAQGKSQTSTIEHSSWWIPTDPIAQRQLVAVLAKMAKCVLDHAEERSDSHQLEPEGPPPPYVEPPKGDVPVPNLLHQVGSDIEPSQSDSTVRLVDKSSP